MLCFLTKLRYHKHKIGTRDSLTQNTFDDNVFDDKLNFDNSVHDLGSPRLPSIAETVESVEKLNEKPIVKEQNGSVPQIFINEVSDKLDSQGENSEQKSFTEEKQTNGKAAKVNTDPAMESLTNEPSDTNDNETCASVSASNGPTFNIAVDEPCVVERALATEYVPAEKPEVKVMCVKEELSVQKTKSRSDSEPDHQSASNCNSSDETEHEAENGETPVLNKWVVCQFLR